MMKIHHLSDGTVVATVRRVPMLCNLANGSQRPISRALAARLVGTLRVRP